MSAPNYYSRANLRALLQKKRIIKEKEGFHCKKNRQSTAIFDWCRAWKLVKPCN